MARDIICFLFGFQAYLGIGWLVGSLPKPLRRNDLEFMASGQPNLLMWPHQCVVLLNFVEQNVCHSVLLVVSHTRKRQLEALLISTIFFATAALFASMQVSV